MEGEKTAIKMKTGKHAKTRTQEKVRTGHMGKHKYRFFFKNTSTQVYTFFQREEGVQTDSE